PLPYGPADGDHGLVKNIQRIKDICLSVGDDFPLMIDCYMSLTVPYTLKLLELIQPYNIKCRCVSAYDIPIVPHGSSIYSYHLQYAFPNLPMSEFLLLSPNGDSISPIFGQLFNDEPLPINGWITLDTYKPGFGVTLNKTNLFRPYFNQNRTK
ncbi:unnamed protein product, partial [Rotaria sordida]